MSGGRASAQSHPWAISGSWYIFAGTTDRVMDSRNESKGDDGTQGADRSRQTGHLGRIEGILCVKQEMGGVSPAKKQTKVDFLRLLGVVFWL